MWFVYALYNSQKNKIYIGITNNLNRRLIEHNEKRGNHYTAKIAGEWRMIYNEEVQNKSAALKREKQLKSFRGREYIKTFISR